MRNIYQNGEYLANNPNWHQEDARWKSQHILRMLKKASLSPMTVCDVGCGTGDVIAELSKTMRSCKFHGFDISEQIIRTASKHKSNNIEFSIGDLPKSRCDLIMLIDVIEHVENITDLLKNIKKCGDYKLFHIPLNLSVTGILKKDFFVRERLSVGHIHIFSKDIALSLLRENGYEIIAWEYTAPAIDRTDDRTISRLGKIMRVILRSINPDFAAKFAGGFSLLVLAK